MIFDEESMFKTTPNIIKILISNDKESAKDYLRNRALSEDDIELLSEFGQYTIEALIVYVLSMVFTSHDSNSMIRVASLVEQLDSNVRLQATLLKCRRCKQSFSTALDKVQKSGKDKRSKLEMMYPFGSGLVQFMEERGLITLISDLRGSVRVKKKQGSYFLPSTLYAFCNFDISLLPIKFNLPMEAQAKDLRQLGAQRMEDAFGHQQRWARRAGTLSTTFMIRVDWTGMTLTQKQNQESRQKLARSGRGFFDPAIPIS
ncbi:hypothetical protein Q3G72_035337 [Acer saccharum]|nr:hypothetical protein Q3G72_035337 [Acer saccharum]